MDIRVNNILRRLNDNGYECYVIGGYVRDYLLGYNTNDYDLCTNSSIFNLKLILKDYPIVAIDFNTLVIKFDDINIDITPYRKELVYNKRKPVQYELVNTLSEDIVRRDFTINTICLDYNNNIVDLINGQQDLNNKIIKVVGNVDKKIREDPLRILRALRFSAYLNFSIDKCLECAIKKYGNLLMSLSYERKKEEINKLIKVRRLDILKRYDLVKYLDIKLDKVTYYDSDILMWLQLDYLGKYCVTRKEKNLIRRIKELNTLGLTDYNMYKYGLDISYLVAEFKKVDILDRYNLLPIKSRADINISSKDILSIIDNPKLINKIYIDLEKKIINKKLINEYAIIMSYLKIKKHTI